MAIITYRSNATITAKPTIVNLGITITRNGQTAKEAIDLITADREIFKKFITSKQSYRKLSYEQTAINIVKKYRTVYSYVLKNPVSFYDLDNSTISYENYMKLNSNEQLKYEKRAIEEFDKYVATLSISAVLNNGDSVINDFAAVFNLAIENDYTCNYSHSLLSDELVEIDNKLYSKCIESGINNLRTIAGKTKSLNKDIKLLEISDNSHSYNESFGKMIDCEMSYGDTNKPIVIPELVEDLFNNNIEFNKSLILKAEI